MTSGGLRGLILAKACSLALLACTLCAAAAGGCDRGDNASTSSTSSAPSPNAPPSGVEVLFTYGSEKQKWIEDVTAAFNAEAHRTAGGKAITVRAVPMGSGESMEELLAGRTRAHLWSPASGVFVKLANARSQVKGGPLVGPTRELVLSPVVIAMWRPMAEALGWPGRQLGWSDIIELAKDPRGWAAHGRGEFGPFKLGHTHPEYSNSGLISLLAEAYAGAGKVKDLSESDLADPRVGQYVEDIEKSVVHYGRSTGFFGRRLFADGPRYLSAAVLYENMVIESYDQPLPMPLVAIYPKEGTIWSDHPIGVVQRDWVDDEHREAAGAYVEYLRAPPQQRKALAYGFRPAEGDVGAPVDEAHGVDPRQPVTTLELPSAQTVDAVVALWRRHKKPARVMLVFDKSGSMKEEDRITRAKNGALQLARMLGERDEMGLVPFSSDVTIVPPEPMGGGGRERLTERIRGLFPEGQTRLYEAVLAARQALGQAPRPDRIGAVVVLTDGEDNGTQVTLERLLEALRVTGEQGDVRVFTIGYGKSARLDDLKRVAEETKGQFFEGTNENIRGVFEEIATFF